VLAFCRGSQLGKLSTSRLWPVVSVSSILRRPSQHDALLVVAPEPMVPKKQSMRKRLKRRKPCRWPAGPVAGAWCSTPRLATRMRYAVRDEPCMTRLTTMAAMPASTALACGDDSMSMIGFDAGACS